MALSGDFLVEFTFTESELKNWIRSQFKADPIGAARLLSDLMVEAVGKSVRAASETEPE